MVALVGGSIASIVTTLLRISHEREESFSDRMLTVADDFVTDSLKAMFALRDAKDTALRLGSTDEKGQLGIRNRPAGEPIPEVDAALDHAGQLVDEAHARFARIQLLFGDGLSQAPRRWQQFST